MAFASAVGLSVTSHSTRSVCGSSGGLSVSARPRSVPVRAAQVPRASQEREREVAPENDELQRALRGRVKELFGDAENVSISVSGDQAEFTVRRGENTDSEYRQAVFTVGSIALISVAIGLLFGFMYWTGAVHGSPSSGNPSGSGSGNGAASNNGPRARYDPYALLEAASRYDEGL